MVKETKDYKKDFLNQGFDATETAYDQRGYHLEVVLDVNQVRKFAQTAYELSFYLVFVTGFHVRSEEGHDKGTSGLEGVYNFARYDRLYRIKGHVSVPEAMRFPVYPTFIRERTGMNGKPGIFTG